MIYVSYIPFHWIAEITETPDREVSSMEQVIKKGIETSQANSTRKSIVEITSTKDINYLISLLQEKAGLGRFNGDTRLFVDAEKGERRFFVDANGVVLEGKHQYKLPRAAFQELKQFLATIYHEPPSK